MRNRKGFAPGLIIGLICGIGLSSFAMAAAVTANPSTHAVRVNGQAVSIEGYNIGGNNFYKLRDLGAVVDFGVDFDSATATVHIDTSVGYTPPNTAPVITEPTTTEAPPIGQAEADGSGRLSDTKLTTKTTGGVERAREDFSQQANPAIFTGNYTRGMYNALYQSFIDRDAIWPGNNGKTAAENFNPYYAYAHAIADSYETRQPFERVMTSISRVYGFMVKAEPYVKDLWQYPGYFIVTAMKPELNLDQSALDVLKKAESMNDREKVQFFTEYVRSRLVYDAKGSASPQQVLSSPQPIKGACGTYAYTFQYLCERSGIPAVAVSGDNHAWTTVYVDGTWSQCDPTNNRVLVEGLKYQPEYPHNIIFAQEILKPNSTK